MKKDKKISACAWAPNGKLRSVLGLHRVKVHPPRNQKCGDIYLGFSFRLCVENDQRRTLLNNIYCQLFLQFELRNLSAQGHWGSVWKYGNKLETSPIP